MIPPRVVILGGGYAALAALSTLADQFRNARVTLIAPRKAHIKITRLHESLRYSLRRLCVPYARLGNRFGFHFVQAKPKFDKESLLRWQNTGTIRFGGDEIRFDYMIVATGANDIGPEKTPHILSISDFCLDQGQVRIRNLCQCKGTGIDLSVIGGGATGVQFLFELSQYLRQEARRPWKLRLVNFDPLTLGQFPGRFHSYVCERMAEEGIEYLSNTAFLRQEGENIVLSNRDRGGEFSLPSNLSLAFMGVRPNPFPVETNRFGQVIVDGVVLERIFAAGDCAHFAGGGANTMSAQVAVRKGRTAAGNIIAHHRSAAMKPYEYAEQGYIVSLGSKDAIGWLRRKGNIVRGISAASIKAAIEKQYDLMLSGIDTYDL